MAKFTIIVLIFVRLIKKR